MPNSCIKGTREGGTLVCYSSHDLNNEPFEEQTILDHSNTELVAIQIPTVEVKHRLVTQSFLYFSLYYR